MPSYRYTLSLSPEVGDVVERLAAKSDLPAAKVIRNLLGFVETDARLFCQWLEGLPKDSPQLTRGLHSLRNPGPGRLLADAAAIERDCGNKLLVGVAAMHHDPTCGGICVVSAELEGSGA